MQEMVSMQYDVFIAPLQILLALLYLRDNPDVASHFTGVGSDAYGLNPMTPDSFEQGFQNLGLMAGGHCVLAFTSSVLLILGTRFSQTSSFQIDLVHLRYFILSDCTFWCIVIRALNLIALFAMIFVPFGVDVSLDFSWVRLGKEYWNDHVG